MVDVVRLRALADCGDEQALEALIREARRKQDGTLVDLAWVLDPVRGFGRGAQFPPSAYPENLQGIHPALAATLYRLEAGVPTQHKAGVEGFTDGNQFVSVHMLTTAKKGRMAGGFSLEVKVGQGLNVNRGRFCLSGMLKVYNQSTKLLQYRLPVQFWKAGDAEAKATVHRQLVWNVATNYKHHSGIHTLTVKQLQKVRAESAALDQATEETVMDQDYDAGLVAAPFVSKMSLARKPRRDVYLNGRLLQFPRDYKWQHNAPVFMFHLRAGDTISIRPRELPKQATKTQDQT